MSEIIFVELLNDEGEIYHSYKEEYWELVKLSGFKTCKIEEIDYQSSNYYINYLKNGTTEAHYNHPQAKNCKCKLILHLMEWGTWQDGIMKGFELESYYSEVWVSDRYFQKLLQDKNPDTRVKYVFFGSHKLFCGQPSIQKWDFVHLSYAYGTREHKMQILANNGYTFAPNGWGEEKKHSLAHSRWGLCLHQFPTPFCNSQRLTLFASWKLPIVSDFIRDPYPYQTFPEGIIHFDPRNTICGDRSAMADSVDMNHFLILHNSFKRSVEEACN